MVFRTYKSLPAAEERTQEMYYNAKKQRHPLFWSSHSVEMPQQLRKVIGSCRDLMAFAQVIQASQSRPPHSSGVQHMRKASFDVLASLAQQPLAVLAARRTFRSRKGLLVRTAQLVKAPLRSMRVTDHRLYAGVPATAQSPEARSILCPR